MGQGGGAGGGSGGGRGGRTMGPAIASSHAQLSTTTLSPLADTAVSSHIVFANHLGTVGAPFKTALAARIEAAVAASDIPRLVKATAAAVAPLVGLTPATVQTTAAQPVPPPSSASSSSSSAAMAAMNPYASAAYYGATSSTYATDLKSIARAYGGRQVMADVAAATAEAASMLCAELDKLKEADLEE